MSQSGIPLKLFTPKNWGTWIGILILRSFAFIPYPLMKILSSSLSFMLYPVAKRRTRVIETNINLCFPEKTAAERRALSHKAFTSTFMAIFEFSLSWWGASDKIARLHTVEGMEHLTNALKKGKGVILLSSHFTTMEIAGTFLCSHIDNLVLTYKRSRIPLLEYFIRQERLRKSAGLIKHKSLREIIRSIKKGNVVWLAPDQDFGRKDAIFAPFMGVMTSTLLSPSRMAKLTGAPVIAFYGARIDEESRYVIRLSPEFENFPSGDDLADATQMNQAIEKQIEKNPEQYLWAHRRFKTRPDGEKDVYT